MKVLPSRLERDLYQDECRKGQGENPHAVTYYVVTNPLLFREDFEALMNEKERVEIRATNRPPSDRKEREKTKAQVLAALDSQDDIIATELINKEKPDQVELIKIPIRNKEFTVYTPFQDMSSPMLLFKTSTDGSGKQSWHRLTKTDLMHLHERGRMSSGTPSLERIANLFTEGIDGNELTRARKMLLPGRNESILALKSLRSALEYALRRQIRHYFIREGQEIREPQKRGYLGFARELNLLSETDFEQARIVMAMANSATHHEYTDIHGLTARIALNWCIEFIGKTIGFHRLDKSKVHGTITSPEYAFEMEHARYRIIRAVLDQVQAHKEYRVQGSAAWHYIQLPEIPAPVGDDTRSEVERQKEFTKFDATEACIAVGDALRKRIASFSPIEKRFFDLLDRYKEFNAAKAAGETILPYTHFDAARMCMFVNGILYESKESDTAQLMQKTTPYDTEDSHLMLAIRRLGRTESRYKKYGLQDIAAGLEKEAGIVKRIARGTTHDTLTPPEWLREHDAIHKA